MTRQRCLLFTHGVFAVLLFVTAHSGAAQVLIDAALYERDQAREDLDAGPVFSAAEACVSGRGTIAAPEPALACAIAYEHAISIGSFDTALRFAVTGCEKHRNASDCRRATGLPLLMGNESFSVPRGYALEMRRLARFVCSSGARITHAYSGDSTGSECANLARQFVLAKDPEYAFALRREAREYFAAAHDPAFAARSYKVACKRWGYQESCGQARLAAAELREMWAGSRATSPATSQAAASADLRR